MDSTSAVDDAPRRTYWLKMDYGVGAMDEEGQLLLVINVLVTVEYAVPFH